MARIFQVVARESAEATVNETAGIGSHWNKLIAHDDPAIIGEVGGIGTKGF